MEEKQQRRCKGQLERVTIRTQHGLLSLQSTDHITIEKDNKLHICVVEYMEYPPEQAPEIGDRISCIILEEKELVNEQEDTTTPEALKAIVKAYQYDFCNTLFFGIPISRMNNAQLQAVICQLAKMMMEKNDEYARTLKIIQGI